MHEKAAHFVQHAGRHKFVAAFFNWAEEVANINVDFLSFRKVLRRVFELADEPMDARHDDACLVRRDDLPVFRNGHAMARKASDAFVVDPVWKFDKLLDDQRPVLMPKLVLQLARFL